MQLELPFPEALSQEGPAASWKHGEKSINGTVGGPGPIVPRQASSGNISMHEHLQQLKTQSQADMGAVLLWP